jgi:photosystem II stability/assembly factor-like uncharacterized protein
MLRKKDGIMSKVSVHASVVLFIFMGYFAQSYAQQIKPTLFSQFNYRHIGPQGNRMIAVVGVPGDLNVYYAGAASGGIWKSTDGGINWKPIFDDQPVSSVGSLAIAPSDTQIIWAGSGETFIRSNISIGNGIYKSTDGGKTWMHMGLEKTGRIGRIVIHPHNPNIVFAAAMGHCYGPQPERGVFRTTDGGKAWERVLFVDENTGCSDIAMDPNNPRILFAGMWQVEIKTWGRWSGGPGSGVFMSIDGGKTWKHLTGHGLPDPPLGKIAVAVAPDNSNRVYSLIETGQRGSLWRSDDGGENWMLVSYNRLLNERPHYYTRMAVAPDDYNEVYFPCNSMSVTYDGGETFELIRWGGDNHDMWIDPTNSGRMMIGNDFSVMISTNHGKGWNKVILPVAQIYHVAIDNQIPYFVYGNRQDGPSYRGPSNSLNRRGITSGMWMKVAGCECGFAIPDPIDNNIVWGGCFNAGLDRFDLRTRHSRSVRVWPKAPQGSPAGLLKYRFNWNFPIVISPHDHNKVYVGSQYVHQTTNGGHSWRVISPDLSTNDTSRMQDSGGLTLDNLGVEYGCCVFAIAESPLEDGVIWAGTNDGLVHVTRDGGTNWTNVTLNIPNLPPWGTVSNIEPSRHDSGTCYITVDFHQVNNRDPYVYKTKNYGKSWKSISSDIPRSVFSYAHCVREDPLRKGLLYLGTENALFVSFNDGANWIPVQSNLPHAPVHWMVIQEHFNDLVVATYGRGFWILDDITPIQQLTPQVLKSDVHLFIPRHAYRFLSITFNQSYPNDQCVGQNPPYGASINYYLKSAPKGDVKITILNESSQTIRTLRGTKLPGINRVWWDLRHEPPKQPKLRTKPSGNPHVWDEKRFKEFTQQGWMPVISWGIRGGLVGPLALPGVYTLKLAVEGQEFSQKLTVKKDPNSAGNEADIQTQFKMALEIRDNINIVVESINRIEWIRKQIHDLTEILKRDNSFTEVITAANKLDKKLTAVEGNYFQKILAEGDLKSYRGPVKLYSQLAMLATDVAGESIGDVGGGSADFPPTIQQIEVHKELKMELANAQRKLNELIDKDIPAFNILLNEENIPSIITRTH